MADKTVGISVTGDISDITGKIDSLLSQMDQLADRTIDLVINTDSSSLQSTEADIQQIGEAAAFTNTELSSIDTTALTGVSTASESASTELESASTAANDVSQNVDKIKPDNINETTQASQNLGQALKAVGGAATALVGVAFFDQMIEGAGQFEDNWSRVAGLMGTSADTVQAEWSGSVAEMKAATGRGASDIQNYLIQMGVAGVTSQDVLTRDFSGIAGAAFMTGQGIDSITQAFRRVVSSGVLGSRQLMSLGLNSQDIWNTTGMTVEQLNEKLKTMDSTSRAALLGEILNKKYAVSGNLAYLSSWERVRDELGRAYNYLMRIFGGLILPVVMPALTFVSGQLAGLASHIQNLDPASRGLLGVVVLLGGGFVVLGTALVALAGLYNALQISQGIATLRTIAQTIATDAQILATNAAIISNNLYNSSVWGTVAAFAKDIIVKGAAVIVTGAQAAATVAATAAQWLLNAAMAANPIGLVVIAVAALVGGLILLYQNNEQVRASIDGLWQQLVGFGAYLETGFINLVDATLQPFKEVIDKIKNFGGELYTAGRDWISNLGRGIQDSMPSLEGTLQKLSDYFPHSPAKIGPLSLVTSLGMFQYGASLIGGLISGLNSKDVASFLLPVQSKILAPFVIADGASKAFSQSAASRAADLSTTVAEKAQKMADDTKASFEAQKEAAKQFAEAAKQAYQDAASAASDAFSVLNESLSGLGISLPKKKVSSFQGLQDLYAARNTNSQAQRKLKSAYEAGGISKSEYDKQMRNLKEEAKQLNDPTLFRQIAQSGKSIGSAWSNGIANGIQSSSDNVSKAIQIGTAAMVAYSPPKEGPLMNVDKWGLSIGQTFTESIAQGIGSLTGMFDASSNFSNIPLPSAASINPSNNIGGNKYEINLYIDELGNISNDEVREKSKIIGNTILDSITKDTVRQASIGGISVQNMLRS